MIVYHGSDVVVDKPILLKPKRTLDFSAGFYTTTNKKQAVNFANKVMLRNDSKTKAVSMYEIDIEEMIETLDVLKFDKPNAGWLNWEETLKRLKIRKLFNQVAFCTKKALEQLKYIGQLDLDHEEG